MVKFFFIITLITILRIPDVFPQVIRPPLNLIRPQETVLEAPRISPQLYNPQFLEAISNIPITYIPPVSPISPNIYSPISPNTATTIVTDCSPAVCKNLVNTIQLMIVCNLLQNTQGGSDFAVQLAAPIINEVISSPNFSCGCSNPLSSLVVPSVTPIQTGFAPPTVISPNMFSNIFNSNGLLYN